MAILVNRYWILLAFATAALVSYSVGYMAGAVVFGVAGVIFDLSLSFELIRRFQKKRKEPCATKFSSWQCRNCRETNPVEFESCWNCEHDRT